MRTLSYLVLTALCFFPLSALSLAQGISPEYYMNLYTTVWNWSCIARQNSDVQGRETSKPFQVMAAHATQSQSRLTTTCPLCSFQYPTEWRSKRVWLSTSWPSPPRSTRCVRRSSLSHDELPDLFFGGRIDDIFPPSWRQSTSQVLRRSLGSIQGWSQSR